MCAPPCITTKRRGSISLRKDKGEGEQKEWKRRRGGEETEEPTNHKHRTPPIKPRPRRILPDILDPVRVPAEETGGEIGERAFDGFGVALEGGFAPADEVVGGLDADEEPAGGGRRKNWCGVEGSRGEGGVEGVIRG